MSERSNKYHDPDKCPVCCGENDFKQHVWNEACLLEVETECSVCGHENYWAHGFYDLEGVRNE